MTFNVLMNENVHIMTYKQLSKDQGINLILKKFRENIFYGCLNQYLIRKKLRHTGLYCCRIVIKLVGYLIRKKALTNYKLAILIDIFITTDLILFPLWFKVIVHKKFFVHTTKVNQFQSCLNIFVFSSFERSQLKYLKVLGKKLK